MGSKVRLKNIAEPLGISIATVYRALNDTGRVSEKTKEIVYAKAKELGYDVDIPIKVSLNCEKVNIAVLCPYDIFFETVVNGMKSATEELKLDNINIEYKFFEVYDVVKQSEQLREIVKENQYDAVAIAPAHPLMLNPLIDELVDGGKIVITFNTDAPDSKRTYYIGQNALVAGKMAAQILGIKIKEGQDIAIFTSFSTTEGVKERKEGFLDFINQSYPDIKILGPFEYYDNIDTVRRIVEQVILNNVNLGGVFANNMVGTLGCARAVKDTGNQGNIFVVGFDSNDEIEQYINEDIITATVLQDPFYQGYLTIKTLLKWLIEDVKVKTEYLYTRCDLLMKSNLELYKK